MEKEETGVDNIVVVEDSEEASGIYEINQIQLSKIFSSEEAKLRVKKLFEKATMLRKKETKPYTKSQILDCQIIEMNDSSDFSHPPALRTGRVNVKHKLKTINSKNKKPETRTEFTSLQSSSSAESSQIAANVSKAPKNSISSDIRGKPGPSVLQSNNCSGLREKTCHLCNLELGETNIKDHLSSCMRQKFEHTKNGTVENNENNPDGNREFTECHICRKDLSYLNSAKRTLHMNACMDQEEKEKRDKEDYKAQLHKARSAVLSCPVCHHAFRSAMRRTAHLKKCAQSSKMSVEQIKNLARQQEEEYKNQLDAGILPAQAKMSGVKGKSKQKKKCEMDEDIQTAIALSTSLLEEKKKTETIFRSSKESSSLLLTMTEGQANERIHKRANDLIFSATPPEASASKTPSHKRKKHPSDLQQSSQLWDRTSLSSPLRSVSSSTALSEQGQSLQLRPPSSPPLESPYQLSSHSMSSYYVPVLMPPIRVNDIDVGSKLRRVSTIPGRQRSLGGHVSNGEENVLKSNKVPVGPTEFVDSSPREEVPSQTVADLAELAAENEEGTFESSDDLYDSMLMSPQAMNIPEEKNDDSSQSYCEHSELDQLSASLLSLVDCPKYSDVQIATKEGILIPAHRVVLFARCPKLLEESAGSILDLSDYRKESVICLLKYVYAGQVSVVLDLVEDVIKLSTDLYLTSLLGKAQKIRDDRYSDVSLSNEEEEFYASVEDSQSCTAVCKEPGGADKAEEIITRDSIAKEEDQCLGHSNQVAMGWQGLAEEENSLNHENEQMDRAKQDSRDLEIKDADNFEKCVNIKDEQMDYTVQLEKEMDGVVDPRKDLDNTILLKEESKDPLCGRSDNNTRNAARSDRIHPVCCQDEMQVIEGQETNSSEVVKLEESSIYSEAKLTEPKNICEKPKTTITNPDIAGKTHNDSEDDELKTFAEEHDHSVNRIFAASKRSQIGVNNISSSNIHTIDGRPNVSFMNEASCTTVQQVSGIEIQHTIELPATVQPLLEEDQKSDQGPELNKSLLHKNSIVNFELIQADIVEKDRVVNNNTSPNALKANNGIDLNSNITENDAPVQQVPSHEITVPTAPTVFCPDEPNTNKDLNMLLFQGSSGVPAPVAEKGKSRRVPSRKKVSQLISKAVTQELTPLELKSIAVKLEKDIPWTTHDPVFIPSVLDDTAPLDPDEIEVTKECIAPQRFKSKRRLRPDQTMSSVKSMQNQKTLNTSRTNGTERVETPKEISIPFPSQLNAKTINSVNVEWTDRLSESKLSTSCNSEDDLFEDYEKSKVSNHCLSVTDGANVLISQNDVSSNGCIVKAAKPACIKDRTDNGNTRHNVLHANNINLNSKGMENDAYLLTDSEQIQMELAEGITADINDIRNAEDLSQSKETESDREIFSRRLLRSSTLNSSANPEYAERTPSLNSNRIPQQSLHKLLPANITPIKRLSSLTSTGMDNSAGRASSSGKKKKTQRGLARIRDLSPLTNNSNVPPKSCSSYSEPAAISIDPSHASSKESSLSDKSIINSNVDMESCPSKSLKQSEVLTVSDDRANGNNSVMSSDSRQYCRRTLVFDDVSSINPKMTSKNESSTQPSANSLVSQILSGEILSSPTVKSGKGQVKDYKEAYLDGLMQCLTSNATELSLENLQHSEGSKSTSAMMPKGSDKEQESFPRDFKLSPPFALSSSVKAKAHLPDTLLANDSLMTPIVAPLAQVSQRSLVTQSGEDSPLQIDLCAMQMPSIDMSYSPVIQKSKGRLKSAFTGEEEHRNSSIVKAISSTGNQRDNLSSKKEVASRDPSSEAVSPAGEIESPLPLRERLGLANPFGVKTKRPEIITNHSSRIVGEGTDMRPPCILPAGDATTCKSKPAIAIQGKSFQSIGKNTKMQNKHSEDTGLHRPTQKTGSDTPKGQTINKGKNLKEPSPFSPMPPFDEMKTPQLERAVSKIGVRRICKKRMRQLLKHVYTETHQYETDSDYEPTPVKKVCADPLPSHPNPRSLSEVDVLPSTGSGYATHNVISDNDIGSCYESVSSSHANSVPSSSSSTDVFGHGKEKKREENDDDDMINSSQESMNSDTVDLPEESILQGWPEEEEVNPTQLTQASSETLTGRLIDFLSHTPDVYEKVLMYEPLELDVLKKRIADAGIKVGMAKLMDFLDEKCITFSMKNMSNRNMRQQPKGRAKAGKTSKTQKEKD